MNIEEIRYDIIEECLYRIKIYENVSKDFKKYKEISEFYRGMAAGISFVKDFIADYGEDERYANY